MYIKNKIKNVIMKRLFNSRIIHVNFFYKCFKIVYILKTINISENTYK